MKTRRQKVCAILVTLFLCASFFAVPVSAADVSNGIYSETFNFPQVNANWFGFALKETSFNNNSFEDLRNPSYVSDPGSYINIEFKLPSSYVSDGVGNAYCSLILGESDFDQTAFTVSNVFWVSPFTVSYRFDLPSGIHQYRLSLRAVDSTSAVTKPIGYSDWVSFPGGSSGKISVVDTLIPISEDVLFSEGGYKGVALCFEFYMESPDYNAVSDGGIYLRFEVVDGVVTANFSKTENPNIPSFTPPSGTDILDENSGLEQDILNSDTVQDLETNTAELFSSLDGSLLNFRDGILFATRCMNIYLVPASDEDGWFHDLVQISLALGIVATLLGITGSIIGAAVKRRGD